MIRTDIRRLPVLFAALAALALAGALWIVLTLSSEPVQAQAGNNAPVFDTHAVTFEVKENSTVNTFVGEVRATDADNDILLYYLEGDDTDKDLFHILHYDGTILTRHGAEFNYEAIRNFYRFKVRVRDYGKNGSDTITVRIQVTDVEEQPKMPARPKVSAPSGSDSSLKVSWKKPHLNGGPDITGYEVKYREKCSGCPWLDLRHSGRRTETTITKLKADTIYQVRVRALNGEKPSWWSQRGEGRTNPKPPLFRKAEVVSSPGPDGEWDSGETVKVRARYYQPVTVEAPPGGKGPEVGLVFFSGDRRHEDEVVSVVAAAWTGEGSGTDTLSFEYRVTSNDDGARTVWAAPGVWPRDARITRATGQPTITGAAQVGKTLTADTSGIRDEDAPDNPGFSYQWLADDADIARATKSTYTLADADEGKAVRVRVSFTDDTGNEETLTSAATDPVATQPNNPATGAPAIIGTAQVHETLTADASSIADTDGLTAPGFYYVWTATDGSGREFLRGYFKYPNYVVQSRDEGMNIRVEAQFADDAGNRERLSSEKTGVVTAAANPTVPEAPGHPRNPDGNPLLGRGIWSVRPIRAG